MWYKSVLILGTDLALPNQTYLNLQIHLEQLWAYVVKCFNALENAYLLFHLKKGWNYYNLINYYWEKKKRWQQNLLDCSASAHYCWWLAVLLIYEFSLCNEGIGNIRQPGGFSSSRLLGANSHISGSSYFSTDHVFYLFPTLLSDKTLKLPKFKCSAKH